MPLLPVRYAVAVAIAIAGRAVLDRVARAVAICVAIDGGANEIQFHQVLRLYRLGRILVDERRETGWRYDGVAKECR